MYDLTEGIGTGRGESRSLSTSLKQSASFEIHLSEETDSPLKMTEKSKEVKISCSVEGKVEKIRMTVAVILAATIALIFVVSAVDFCDTWIGISKSLKSDTELKQLKLRRNLVDINIQGHADTMFMNFEDRQKQTQLEMMLQTQTDNAELENINTDGESGYSSGISNSTGINISSSNAAELLLRSSVVNIKDRLDKKTAPTDRVIDSEPKDATNSTMITTNTTSMTEDVSSLFRSHPGVKKNVIPKEAATDKDITKNKDHDVDTESPTDKDVDIEIDTDSIASDVPTNSNSLVGDYNDGHENNKGDESSSSPSATDDEYIEEETFYSSNMTNITNITTDVVESVVFGRYEHSPKGTVSGELKKWHKVTIGFEGPRSSEKGSKMGDIPFLDYRLDVTFTFEDSSTNSSTDSFASTLDNILVVPGFFAADGNAANTEADDGNVWLVHFMPTKVGMWTWKASFLHGPFVATLNLTEAATVGKSGGHFDGATGSFTITDAGSDDARAKGMLRYVGASYLQYAESGEYFMKIGASHPENLFAYEDFDNTPNYNEYRKSYQDHVVDYHNESDRGDQQQPSWHNGTKGMGLIGAINYLSSQGLNALSVVTYTWNTTDGGNVFPYINARRDGESYNYYRFDVSKLSQWEIVLEHANRQGMMVHLKTQKSTNDRILDNLEPINNPESEQTEKNSNVKQTDEVSDYHRYERRVYFRELIARFGHLPALQWNLGLETTLPIVELLTWIQYVHDLDPYHHPIVVQAGRFGREKLRVYNELLGLVPYTGVSLYTNTTNILHDTGNWVVRSALKKHRWVVTDDEQDDDSDVFPDAVDPSHDATRTQVLWANLMAGGSGVEYSFGGDDGMARVTCDEFRSRENMWRQSRIALDFYALGNVPYWDLHNAGMLLSEANSTINQAVSTRNKSMIVLYLRKGGTESLDLVKAKMSNGNNTVYEVRWYDPIRGGELQRGSVETVPAGKAERQAIGTAPSNVDTQDWVVLLRINGEGHNSTTATTNTTTVIINATISTNTTSANSTTTKNSMSR